MSALDIKRAKLDARFRGYKGEVAVALSCYDENPFLLPYLKTIVGAKVFALTADAEIFAKSDQFMCQMCARNLGIDLFTVSVQLMNKINFIVNDEKRCYFCRHYLLGNLAKAARSVGARNIITGLTADSLVKQPYVAEALDSLGVTAPLAEAGLTTADIKRLAVKTGIKLRPAGRCAVKQVPRGLPLDNETIQFLSDAEAFLRRFGLNGARMELLDAQKAHIVCSKRCMDKLDNEAQNEIRAFMRARHFEIINLNSRQI